MLDNLIVCAVCRDYDSSRAWHSPHPQFYTGASGAVYCWNCWIYS